MAAQQLDEGNPMAKVQQLVEGPFTAGTFNPDDPPRARSNTMGIDMRNLQPATASSSSQQVQPSGGTESQLPYMTSQSTASNIRGSWNTQSSVPQVPSEMGPTTPNRQVLVSRSPFSTPITCPPRNRPNQILIINPTSTLALTTMIMNTLRPHLPQAVEATAYTASYPSPTAVESVVDMVLSSETTLRDLAKYSTNDGETIQNYDGLLLACYCNHALTDALRESYDVPVIGIMEASLHVARMLGGRFGVVTTSTRMKIHIEDALAAFGVSRFSVGVESLHVNPLDLLGLSSRTTPTSAEQTPQMPAAAMSPRFREELNKRMATQSRLLVAKGAETVILGSEFLSSLEAIRVVKDAVRDEDGRRTVNVIDAVEAGVLMLNGLISMGVPTSKKGLFRGEREGRRGRGQNWL